ncbi:hypothetical protein KR054_012336 [Drosophila jambulina]|nr:hypothetical protein KR054_012336 [Drosophila jambulina]
MARNTPSQAMDTALSYSLTCDSHIARTTGPSALRRRSSRAQMCNVRVPKDLVLTLLTRPMCNVRVPKDLVLTLLTRPVMRDKNQKFAFKDYVKSHPEMRF